MLLQVRISQTEIYLFSLLVTLPTYNFPHPKYWSAITIKKIRNVILASSFTAIAILVGYTYYDNTHVVVTKQDIGLTNLPKELDGFTILQVSDLHEYEFGKHQKQLLKKINAVSYDAIVFTGDMLVNGDSTNYQPFYTLLDGIRNKENMLYVPGNDDPESYVVDQTVKKSAFVQGMEKRGVRMLESIDTIAHNGENVHFVNFELSIRNGQPGVNEGVSAPSYAGSPPFLAYQKQRMKELQVLDDVQKDTDVVITLDHYPAADARMDYIQDAPDLKWRDYDLLIAGHYHGGQIRLPFFGALFVPEAWSNNHGFFPQKDRVKGLWEYKGIKQYVSTGLGSSGAIPFLKFRLFNPPEINVLTLQ